MKLAITGGAGFLGYHLSHKLADKYDEIILIDPAPVDLKEHPPNVRYAKADIRDAVALRTIFKNVDFVIHGAAALPLYSAQEIFDVNVGGTRNVLTAAQETGVQRVVAISSTAVYGVPDKHPLYESDSMVGVGPYGETKIVAEKMYEEYRQKGMCIPVVRPKTFIGTTRLGVFQILYDWVDCGKKIPIIGNGKNRYQLLEVEDLVDAIYILLTANPEFANDTFNIGAEEFRTVLEDVGALCTYAGKGACVLPTPAGLVVPALALFEKLKLSPLYKWVYGTASKDSFVSIEKMKSRFNWKPKYSNAEALIRSYQWYVDHKDELSTEGGVTHRVGWKQGVLGLVKNMM